MTWFCRSVEDGRISLVQTCRRAVCMQADRFGSATVRGGRPGVRMRGVGASPLAVSIGEAWVGGGVRALGGGGWARIRCVSSPAARSPEPDRSAGRAVDVDGLDSVPEWVGDGRAAALFGSPEAIRAALLPEHLDEFDAAFDAALTAARRTLRLDQLRLALQVWRRVALLTREDVDAARRLVAATVEVRRTGSSRPGSVSWSELRAELGL